MLSKLLLSLSLAVSPIVSVSAQVQYTEFDTFQTADKYLQDFDYLTENTYRLSSGDFVDDAFEVDYLCEAFVFYVFPIYYDFATENNTVLNYYENENYVFYRFEFLALETVEIIHVYNYIGSEVEMPFIALDYIGMSQVIEHDKIEKSNSISIYNSFYNFFTGFFPNEVVAEYHGIFTFVIVAFLLFLVFGFVFFLFRVIRRLVGFK